MYLFGLDVVRADVAGAVLQRGVEQREFPQRRRGGGVAFGRLPRREYGAGAPAARLRSPRAAKEGPASP